MEVLEIVQSIALFINENSENLEATVYAKHRRNAEIIVRMKTAKISGMPVGKVAEIFGTAASRADEGNVLIFYANGSIILERVTHSGVASLGHKELSNPDFFTWLCKTLKG